MIWFETGDLGFISLFFHFIFAFNIAVFIIVLDLIAAMLFITKNAIIFNSMIFIFSLVTATIKRLFFSLLKIIAQMTKLLFLEMELNHVVWDFLHIYVVKKTIKFKYIILFVFEFNF